MANKAFHPGSWVFPLRLQPLLVLEPKVDGDSCPASSLLSHACGIPHPMSKGAVKKRPRTRFIEDIPGTVEPGFKDRPINEVRIPPRVREAFTAQGISPEEISLQI